MSQNRYYCVWQQREVPLANTSTRALNTNAQVRVGAPGPMDSGQVVERVQTNDEAELSCYAARN